MPSAPIGPDDLVRRLADDLDLPLHAQSALSKCEDVALPDGLRIGLVPCGDDAHSKSVILRLTVPVPPAQWTESFCVGLLRKTARTHVHGLTLACDDEFNVLVLLTGSRDVADSPDAFVRWARQWIERGASKLARDLVEAAA